MANPFASMEAENPFALKNDDKPFADPSIQEVAGEGNSAASQAALDNYDPFTNKTSSNGGPSVMEEVPAVESPPAYNVPTSSSAGGPPPITTADFERRQEELERRARDLERREEELKNSPYSARQNNWPPLPSFCPFQPCFYQDINVDIPVNFQTIVRYLYYLWIWHVCLLFVNTLVALCYVFIGGDYGTTFALSLVYLVVFTPASFLCWFRPGYKAFRNDSSFNFMVFFFVFFFQVIVSVFNTIGIGSGTTGLITSIKLLSSGSGENIFVGVLMLFISIGFAVAALADIYLLNRIYQLFRFSGGSVEKAQREFQDGVMSNDQVRQAAADTAAFGFRSTFGGGGGGNNSGGGNPPQPDNRY